tara:strand:+ start:899 stop:1156 length:258 start_codon:yes stop_codon:yes gene_type:complete
METLRITTTNKEEAIKEINKFRLSNKNNWYQIELNYSPYVYKMKIYNTWIQIFMQCENNTINYNTSGPMDINIKQFKEKLSNLIK